MNAPLSFRCSSLPLFVRCPAAARPSAVLINATHEAADNGTATHEALRPLPTTNRIDWDSIPAIAAKYGADVDETRMLTAQGVKLWNKVRGSFQNAMTEVSLSTEIAPGVTLTGHADLLAVSERAMRIGDWKTGRKDRDHSQQFKGYAALALLASDDLDEVTGTGLWVRDQEIENYTMNRADALRWLKDLVERVVQWDGVYHPGDHCEYCPRSHECEAVNAMVRRDLAIITDRDLVSRLETEIATMPPDELVDALHKAELIGHLCDRVRDAIRQHVIRSGDVVGKRVRLTVLETKKRELDPLAAWSVLEAAGFKDEDFARSMKLSITAVEKLVAQKAGKGKGAGAVRKLAEDLRAAGAVNINTSHRLEEKRTA